MLFQLKIYLYLSIGSTAAEVQLMSSLSQLSGDFINKTFYLFLINTKIMFIELIIKFVPINEIVVLINKNSKFM